jgi:two-component system, OmpR family, sensor histidine kinase SenX3
MPNLSQNYRGLGAFGDRGHFRGHIVNLVNNLSLAVIFLTIALAVVGAAVGGFSVGRSGFKRDANADPIPFPTLAAEVLELFGSVGILLDQSNQVIRMNNRAEPFGLVNRGLLVHSELIDLAQRARESKNVEVFEGILRVGLRSDKISVLAKASLVTDDYVVLVLEDLTKDLRLDKTRRDFIENISHELKTPIGAITLLAEAIQGAGDDTETIKKFANNLIKESNRLTLLVQDIIELSRLQSEEVLAQAELVNLGQVISEAVDRTEQLASSRQIKILVGEKSSLEVFGNRDLLTTAVRNLIENAVVYSEAGSQIGIGCSEIKGVAEIAVTDTGVGISVEDQKRIFERFYRVDPSRSRQTGGTGLGLSIVKHVAKIHRGEVKLFSQVGVGSTFTLRLPLAKESDPITGTINVIAEAD